MFLVKLQLYNGGAGASSLVIQRSKLRAAFRAAGVDLLPRRDRQPDGLRHHADLGTVRHDGAVGGVPVRTTASQ